MRFGALALCLAVAGCGPLPCLNDYCRDVRAGRIAPPPVVLMQQPAFQPARGPSTTTCNRYFSGVRCETY